MPGGLGRAFAEAALDSGERVAATIRQDSVIDELAAKHGDRLLPRLRGSQTGFVA